MSASLTNSKITVAYADDHVAVRKGIISYLHDIGGIDVVIEAGNGQELVQLLTDAVILPDVCIMDIKMPDMDGFEATAIIKQRWKGMKILVLTTFLEEYYVVRMIRAGVNGYLSKSCDPEEIKEALVSIAQKGMYYSGLYVEKAMIAVQDDKMRIPNFTEKERIFLKHCCSDLTYAEISLLMKCSVKSVEGYRDSLFKKLAVNSRVSLALFAVKTGIIPMDSGPL